MPAVPGRQFLSGPDGEAKRFVAQLKFEALKSDALESDAPAVTRGRWPNVPGWVEMRQRQRRYDQARSQLLADGVPEDEARRRAMDVINDE